VRIIDKLLGIDKLKSEIKAYQSAVTTQLYTKLYPDWKSFKAVLAYKTMDDIFSVVRYLATNTSQVAIYGYNAQMEDLPETDKLATFLRKLTFAQRLEMFTWSYLKDECFIYKEKTLGVNGTVEKIHILNPGFVTLAISDSFPQEVVKYFYQDPNNGFEKVIELDEIIFIHGFNPSDNPLERFRGFSRVNVLGKRLTRLSANMDNSVAQMQNGGVPGVMYFKDIPNTGGKTKGVADAAKDNFSKYLTNSANKGAPFITAGEVGYFSLGSNLVDLASIDLEEVDFKKICNAWGISTILFNSDAASTESNVKEMKRAAYTNAIIPMLRLYEDAFNNELVTDFGAGFRQVKWDIDGIPEMQQSLKEKVDALAAAPVMIPNDVLEAMGYDRVDNELMNQPLIKTGYEPIDNFEPLPPVE
jgi:HK97 family phage portal protein